MRFAQDHYRERSWEETGDMSLKNPQKCPMKEKLQHFSGPRTGPSQCDLQSSKTTHDRQT